VPHFVANIYQICDQQSAQNRLSGDNLPFGVFGIPEKGVYLQRNPPQLSWHMFNACTFFHRGGLPIMATAPKGKIWCIEKLVSL
jgi:hypothetical protein